MNRYALGLSIALSTLAVILIVAGNALLSAILLAVAAGNVTHSRMLTHRRAHEARQLESDRRTELSARADREHSQYLVGDSMSDAKTEARTALVQALFDAENPTPDLIERVNRELSAPEQLLCNLSYLRRELLEPSTAEDTSAASASPPEQGNDAANTDRAAISAKGAQPSARTVAEMLFMEPMELVAWGRVEPVRTDPLPSATELMPTADDAISNAARISPRAYTAYPGGPRRWYLPNGRRPTPAEGYKVVAIAGGIVEGIGWTIWEERPRDRGDASSALAKAYMSAVRSSTEAEARAARLAEEYAANAERFRRMGRERDAREKESEQYVAKMAHAAARAKRARRDRY